jgi:hypothetical protein
MFFFIKIERHIMPFWHCSSIQLEDETVLSAIVTEYQMYINKEI